MGSRLKILFAKESGPVNLQQSAKIFLTLVLLVGAVILTYPATVRADLLTYCYTGNPFTEINVAALGTNLTGVVQVDIPDDFTGVVAPASFLDWSLTAGSATLTPATVTLFIGKGLTFDAGNIIQWELLAMGGSPWAVMSTKHNDLKDSDAAGTSFSLAQINSTNIPGTWTCEPAAVVPLPPATLLFATGLVGLGVLRSRFKKA